MSRNVVFFKCIVTVLGLITFPRACLGVPSAAGSGESVIQEAIGAAAAADVGSLAPDFVLSNVEGRSITLSEFRGRDILLVFVSVGCPYCSAKIPLLNEADRGGLKVISVALGATAAQVREYINEWNVEFDMLPDPSRTVGEAYGIHSVPAPFWIDPDGVIAWGGADDGPQIRSLLNRQEVQMPPPSELQVYLVPYVGDIDGSIDTEWFDFYRRLLEWHNANSIPGSCSFYPDTMNDESFNQIIAAMYASPNVELVLKGEHEYKGKPLPSMTYWQVKEALQAWQCKFVAELEELGLSDIKLPMAYNQLLMEFTPIMRDAAHDVGFKMFFDQGTGGFEHVSPLPDFDITQYSVPLTVSGMPGPDENFKDANEVIQEVLDYEDDWMIYINGIKVVPVMCHQQDFRSAEESSVIDEDKWEIYTSLLTTANEDPRIQLLRPEEVYNLRHKDRLLRDHILTDFESDDHGWVARGIFEIGVPEPIDSNEGECVTDCFGTGPPADHSPIGVNAACTNLDGYLGPEEFSLTNTLLSPVYDFSGRSHVSLELWRFMEMEGSGYDLCYYQYKNDPAAEWSTFEAYGVVDDGEVNDDYWTKYSIDLSSVADGRSYFQLRFYCTTDDYLEGSGLCLDDIKLSWAVFSDFNADRKVDFGDFTKLAAAFLTAPGDSKYDDVYDLTDKGIINSLDIAVFADDWLVADQMPEVPIQICDWQGGASGAASISIDDSMFSCIDVLGRNDLNFKATFYLSGTNQFSQADWDMWKSVFKKGHEIGCHTNTHACIIQDEETLRWDISSNISDILTNMSDPNTNMSADDLTSFAWPCGVNDANTRAIAAEYFVSARGYHINELEDKNPADFMDIKSLNTPHYHDPAYDPPDYFQMADEAESLGKWVNFVFHNHCDDDGAISYLATKDLWVAPVGTVAKYIKERQNSSIENLVQTREHISFVLASNLDPVLFNEELTIKASINPVYVQAVFVDASSVAFTSDTYDITFNVAPSGNNNIRIVKAVIPITPGCSD